jgi:hypothetical protein
MDYWTDHEPARKVSIEIPASLELKCPPPVFRYRGFFINDEDLLSGWAPGEAGDHTGIYHIQHYEGTRTMDVHEQGH